MLPTFRKTGWTHGCKYEFSPWYKDDLVFLEVAYIRPGGAVSRPVWTKSFLIGFKGYDPLAFLAQEADSLAWYLSGCTERRDDNGHLEPITVVNREVI